MTPIRVEAPSVEPVTLAEMRAYLRLDPDDGGAEDGLIAALIAAARVALEQETRRILVPGRFRLSLADWPPGDLPLPLSPVTGLLRAGLAGRDGGVTDLAPGRVQLRGDGLEVAALGSLRLHDEPPRGSLPVYAMFGDAEIRDASVDGAERQAHTLALVVFAKPGSSRTALDTAARMAALLTGTDLVLTGHALVTCRVLALAATRDPLSGEARATLTLQAVTETA
ncbi:head-tail connector protein [Methylobacterium soli]|uniref:DUF3168 domain-containing protein n=1 Tax=Methylobacterium soli TaxID=553447 RepID=A0A6L3SXP2_9HYPH|nr:DUF3168 domain-containing protein [Methylobacterium soli]KAB1076936.1 DUF3168 domain-containing protein [Methylobacterium soli]